LAFNISIFSVPDEGYFERTWWRLFWAYLMNVILSVPDEGYFERTRWRLFWATWWMLFWAYLMKVILSVPDEGYFERTWWRLFQNRFVSSKFDIYVLFTSWGMFKVKRLENQIIVKSLGTGTSNDTGTSKGLRRTANIDLDHLCPQENTIF
jgi:hypothetical protein